jgi:hypothetical protein
MDPVFKTLWCERTEQWTRLNTCEICYNLFLALPFLKLNRNFELSVFKSVDL